MSSSSPPAESWWTRGQHPGHSSLSGLRASAPSRFPSPDFWTSAQTPLYSLFCSIKMGCGRDLYLGKRAASGRDDGVGSGPTTASALYPPTPPLYGISQALTCRDLEQFLFRLLLFSAAPARPQGNRELVLRREQGPGQEGLLHTSALGHVRAT